MADNPSVERYQARVRAGEDPGDAFADFLATIGSPAGRSSNLFNPRPYTADCDADIFNATGQCVSTTRYDDDYDLHLRAVDIPGAPVKDIPMPTPPKTVRN